MARDVKELERRHETVLGNWDGDMDRLVEVRRDLAGLWRLSERQDVVEALRTKPVPVLDAPPVVR